MLDLLKRAIKQYGLNSLTLSIKKVLQPTNWHGDLHYQIEVDGKYYSARFLRRKRYEQTAFVELTDEVLNEQIIFCRYLYDSGIPFMKHCSTKNDELFLVIRDEENEWRFVLFEWIAGKHITHCSEIIAERFSVMASKIHHISSMYESDVFTRKSHLEGYKQFHQLIVSEVETSSFWPYNIQMLEQYLTLATYHIETAKVERMEYIIQLDLNPLNVLWSNTENINGIVDFESITYTDRVEGLAWLIKWYSRTKGIGSNEMSPLLAKAVLRGYGANQLLSKDDFNRLPSLLWLSGCLNWNFTAKTIELIKSNQNLKEHLTSYIKRGELLYSLIK
jgi:Ser/Thr protein kinase RdoA (MazF antagonist)